MFSLGRIIVLIPARLAFNEFCTENSKVFSHFILVSTFIKLNKCLTHRNDFLLDTTHSKYFASERHLTSHSHILNKWLVKRK